MEDSLGQGRLVSGGEMGTLRHLRNLLGEISSDRGKALLLNPVLLQGV